MELSPTSWIQGIAIHITQNSFVRKISDQKILMEQGHHKSTGIVSDDTLQLTLKKLSLGEFGVIIKEHPNIHKGY